MASGKVVKEYQFILKNLNLIVFAQIIFKISGNGAYPYHYAISHYYKPFEYAGLYISGRNYGETLEEVEELLEKYVNGFTSDGVIPNHFYNVSRKEAFA